MIDVAAPLPAADPDGAGTLLHATAGPDVLLATVEAMGALVDLRDGYALGHSDAMVELAQAVGTLLGVTAEDEHDLRIAARLHDLGKVGVPDDLLRKNGPLDDTEWAVVRRHAVWGAEVLSRVPGLERVARIVRHHHERWDGTGYPDGLGGPDIPLVARVIGACEAWAALVSDRPYRAAFDPDTALRALAAGSGTQFDPDVCSALRAVVGDGSDTRFLPGGKAAGPGVPRKQGGAQPRGLPTRDRLAHAFERLETLPALNESRDRLVALLDRGRPGTAELTAVIESDVALVTAVLRAARAARPTSTVGSVPQAVETLGPQGVRVLAESIRTVGVFERLPGWAVAPEQFRLHAVATQRAAQRIARLLDARTEDELIVAALLHDVGQLVLMEAYPGYPHEIHGRAVTPEERLQAERRELGLDHAVAGGVLLRRWGLSRDVARVVEHHHDTLGDRDAMMVRLADMIAHHARGRPLDARALAATGRELGLDGRKLRALLYEVADPSPGQKQAREPSPLSKPETRVLRGLASGLQYKEIAEDLSLSPSTVRSHCHNVYRKIGAHDRAQAVLMATERGWL